MAVNFSENQLNFARKKFYGKFYVTKSRLNFFDKLLNKILILIYQFKYNLVNIKRKTCRLLIFQTKNKSNKKSVNFSLNLSEVSIQKYSEDLKTKNFTFIENFLSKETYEYICNNWPSINYFDHNKKIIKHYNTRRIWSIEKKFSEFKDPYNLRLYFEFMLSNEFKKFYQNLVKFEDKEYEIRAISSAMAPQGSYLIPHIDGIIRNTEDKKNYNFIYFLNGFDENPILGGGTGFYKDNEFELPIFIPSTIKNSLVIYNQCEDFYHGFRLIDCPKNIVRKSINFQIQAKG
tara:strand:+ start:4355 stop:5221 length:867 start_codon:yes stop_codon:yes gene_type:complete